MRYVILGLIQGLTEFLPVSSSSHLAISQNILGIETPGVAFEVLVHLGTSFAAILWFRQELTDIFSAFGKSISKLGHWNSFFNFVKNNNHCQFAWLLFISTIPGAIFGYLFQDSIELFFNSFLFIAAMLTITGIGLFLADKFFTQGNKKISGLSSIDALLIGLAQAFAIIPGISRSGFTIMIALSRGLERKYAATYSFILSIPIIFGASFCKFKEISQLNINVITLLISVLTAFLSGYLAIGFFIKMLNNYKLRFFSYYLWILSALIFFFKIKN